MPNKVEHRETLVSIVHKKPDRVNFFSSGETFVVYAIISKSVNP